MRDVGLAGLVVTAVVGAPGRGGGPLLRALDISVPNGLVAAAFVLIGGGDLLPRHARRGAAGRAAVEGSARAARGPTRAAAGSAAVRTRRRRWRPRLGRVRRRRRRCCGRSRDCRRTQSAARRAPVVDACRGDGRARNGDRAWPSTASTRSDAGSLDADVFERLVHQVLQVVGGARCVAVDHHGPRQPVRPVQHHRAAVLHRAGVAPRTVRPDA